MSLPEAIRVRISSRLQIRSPPRRPNLSIMPIDEIAAEVLGISGKDAERVKEILRAGRLFRVLHDFDGIRCRWNPATSPDCLAVFPIPTRAVCLTLRSAQPSPFLACSRRS